MHLPLRSPQGTSEGYLPSICGRGISTVDASGDGTGYSPSMTSHHRSILEREGESVKEGGSVHSSALMDPSTRMYVGYAISPRSGKDAYHRAPDMIAEMRIDPRSARPDRYHSGRSILDDLGEGTGISRIRGRKGWRGIVRRFMDDPIAYLEECFRRNNSEAGFSAGKRSLGGIMTGRRSDRIETSGFCKGLIHNLMLMNG